MASNEAGKRYLTRALNNLWVHRFPNEEAKMPANVVRAKKLVDRWEKRRNEVRRRIIDKRNAAKERIREMILFGDPKDALAALRKLEQEIENGE